MKALRIAFIAMWLLAANLYAQSTTTVSDSYGGRTLLVYVPKTLPPSGSRALVVVLHGGLGNAQRIASQQSEVALNMNAAAEKYGFVVAYLNGTHVARMMGPNFLGWNAGGGCCGLPFQNKTDDVGYIRGAVGYLAGKYGIDPKRVYGMGHSNGAMMAQRMICESDVFAAAVPVSGPLAIDGESCPSAHGKRVLAIHGADDKNVPVAGGVGTAGMSGVDFKSEERTRQTLTRAGATYELDLVKGADHPLDHIEAAVERSEGLTIQEKAARFFGLVHP